MEPQGLDISLWKEKEPIFVCGMLMDPEFHSTIIGREAAMAPAVALNCHRDVKEVAGKPYTFLIKGGDGFVTGMLLLGISKEERSRLYEFEEINTVRKVEELSLKIGKREFQGISFFKR
jgi:Gamma-glutamyl cyclotransferase, AIG2-like